MGFLVSGRIQIVGHRSLFGDLGRFEIFSKMVIFAAWLGNQGLGQK